MSVEAIGLLHEPVRRAVYEYAAAQAEPVGRDEVAEAVGIGRTLAAFHLDKLAAAGLLEVSFARRSGRTGPGAGRPAKLYRRARIEHAVSVPPREYRVLAEILAEAVESAGAEAAAQDAAYRYGAALVERHGGADVTALWTRLGYQPVVDDGELRLRNCPFGAVAHSFPHLVCGLNLALVRGALSAAGFAERVARLDPRPDACCVVITVDLENADASIGA
jgi:predicted ArsR family transcriptional regulator